MAYKMFSRVFPKGHSKEGKKTHFVEKIWAGFFFRPIDKESLKSNEEVEALMMKHLDNEWNGVLWDIDVVKDLVLNYSKEGRKIDFKVSTIRGLNIGKDGMRLEGYKPGQIFDARVWSGEPYKSKQVVFTPPLTVQYTHKFEVLKFMDEMVFRCNGTVLDEANIRAFAYYDGLEKEDFKEWFKEGMEEGQVIIYSL